MSKNKKIGKCPYCKGDVTRRDLSVHGKKVKLYVCSNMKVEYDDGDERFLETQDSTCGFRIFSNSLLKYNKRTISEKEVKELISQKQQTVVRLYSKKLYNENTGKYGSEYFRYAVPDPQYGISVLFNEEVEDVDLKKISLR